ncbi:MAG: ABC transporter ATP-binding protein [Rhizobium sp.]|nr:ABC transporter ATP-binding protein [Rhizobium sp.]
MTHPILAGRGLCFATASGKRILDTVSVDIADGERLAIVGPNGAGKSTLLRLLAGMTAPASGSVSLFGRDMCAMRPVERARLVAVVGQVDQPDHRISVRDYVGLGRIPHHGRRDRPDDRAIVEAAMERTTIQSFARREMGSLSGGERQRAQIARALAQEPRILFLDEPTNHLDPRARAELMRLVAELDLTVVAVLHDLHIVPEFATAVAILDKGRLVASGPADVALARDTVRTVFGIDLLRIPHPVENRHLMVFDIPSNL